MRKTLETAASTISTMMAAGIIAGCGSEVSPDLRTGLTYAPEDSLRVSMNCIGTLGKMALGFTIFEDDMPLTLFAREGAEPNAGVTAVYLGDGKLEFITSDMRRSEIVDFGETTHYERVIDKGPDTYDLKLVANQLDAMNESPLTSVAIACMTLPLPGGATPKEL